MFRDKSVLSLSGSSQLALGPNGNRQLLQIENAGTSNVAVNFSGPATGGTGTDGVGNVAAIGGTGCLTIVPTASVILARVVPQNPVNVIGASGQPIVIIEA